MAMTYHEFIMNIMARFQNGSGPFAHDNEPAFQRCSCYFRVTFLLLMIKVPFRLLALLLTRLPSRE